MELLRAVLLLVHAISFNYCCHNETSAQPPPGRASPRKVVVVFVTGDFTLVGNGRCEMEKLDKGVKFVRNE